MNPILLALSALATLAHAQTEQPLEPTAAPLSTQRMIVQKILGSRRIRLLALTPGPCPTELVHGSRLILLSKEEGSAIGFADADEIEASEAGCRATARVLIHEAGALVVEGDEAVQENLRDHTPLLPGRIDLQLRGTRRYSARYKPLAYFGPFYGDGQVLDQGESLLDPFALYQYGISDKFTLETLATANFVGVINGGFKYEALDTSFVKVTTGALLGHVLEDHDTYLRLQALLTIPSNSRIQSHTQVTYFFRPQNGLQNSLTDPQISVINEFIMSSWDRLLFGPTYNFELKSVGGFASLIFIWNHLHLSVGLQTQNFMKLNFNQRDAYTPTFGVWWRY